jgi:DNA polymerase III epsilon subunit-like protein
VSYDPKQVAFVDTETAGLHPDKHPIWEIGVIVDGEEYVWQQQMFGGGKRWKEWVDPWVVENMPRIIDEYDPAKALTLRSSVNQFVELVRGRHVVGCNPRFDMERIHRTWRAFHQDDWEEPWNYHLIDVEALMLGWRAHGMRDTFETPTLPWKASDLARQVGVNPEDFEPKHSALADARFARACFEAVMGGPI